MVPADEILEALELSRAEPGIGYLERLFAVFNERVPFETASKIVRNAEVQDWTAKPRRPEIFWKEHLEMGAGGTCFARVAAFEALLSQLGFDVRPLLGAVTREGDHAALAVTLGGKDWICDVGFPLPALLPCVEGETDSALGAVRLSRGPAAWKVELSGGVPEGPRSLELFDEPVSAERFAARWESTFRPDSTFLAHVKLRRQTSERAVSFVRGELRIDDRHARARIPIAAPRSRPLEREFGLDPGLLDRAFSIAGDPDSDLEEAELSVYLESESSAEKAFDAIAAPEGYASLMEGAARVASWTPAREGWRATLVPPEESAAASSSFEEAITPDAARRRVRVVRGGRASFYEAAIRNGRPFLVRRAPLPGSAEELSRNHSLRGRLAATLAGDLLAWERLLSRVPGSRVQVPGSGD